MDWTSLSVRAGFAIVTAWFAKRNGLSFWVYLLIGLLGGLLASVVTVYIALRREPPSDPDEYGEMLRRRLRRAC